MQTIARQLRGIRQESGMTQTNVADMAGVSAASLSRYETNILSPTLSTLERWCKALRVNLIINLKDEHTENSEHS